MNKAIKILIVLIAFVCVIITTAFFTAKLSNGSKEETTYSEAETETETERRTTETTMTETSVESTTETTIPEEDLQTFVNFEWAETYQQILTDIYNDNSYDDNNTDDICFSLIYINDDDIPELVVSNGEAHVSGCDIYTYDSESDAEVFLGSYGSFGIFYYSERQGIILEDCMGQGYYSAGVYKMNGNSMDTLLTFANDEGAVGDDAAAYQLNGSEVSRDEYYSAVADYSYADYEYENESADSIYTLKCTERTYILTPSNITEYCR